MTPGVSSADPRVSREALIGILRQTLGALKALKLEHESWCSSSRPQAFNPVYREWIRGGALSRTIADEVQRAIDTATAALLSLPVPQQTEQQRDELLAELKNIANANPSTWEPDVRDQFRPWAQNRARYAIAKVEASLPVPTEEQSPPDNADKRKAGLYAKFRVERTDDQSQPGGQHVSSWHDPQYTRFAARDQGWLRATRREISVSDDAERPADLGKGGAVSHRAPVSGAVR